MSQTYGLLEYCEPEDWRSHHFGLPSARWQALSGRVYWVTGAATGYGAALSAALTAAGATVFMSGRRAEKLEAARTAMTELGVDAGPAHILPCDVTDESQLAGAAERIAVTAGGLDGVVISAALPQQRIGPWPFTDLPRERWQAMLDTNITAPWLTMRTALPLMLRRNAARAVLLTSEAGWASTPGFGPYNMTKAALNSLAMSMAAEAAAAHPDADIQINTLNPGEARSEMNQGSTVSPFTAAAMVLALLSHPPSGPNGCFFVRDGRHWDFAYAKAWPHSLV